MAMDGTPIIIKKKKVHGHAHHGGSWKVAYADFVTAMMAFFLVLWIMGLSDQTRTQVAGYFNDPMGYSKTPPLSKNLIPFKGMESPKPGESKKPGAQQETDIGNTRIQNQLEKAIRKAESGAVGLAGKTDITITKEGVRLEFIEDGNNVFFESGSAELTPAAKTFVAQLSPVLRKIGSEMIIEGHTDAKPFAGTGYDNFDLSTDRAMAIKHEIQRDGVPSDLLTQIRGYGATRLKVPSQPYSFQNRRVAILIAGGMPKKDKVDLVQGEIKEDMTPNVKPDLAPAEISLH